MPENGTEESTYKQTRTIIMNDDELEGLMGSSKLQAPPLLYDPSAPKVVTEPPQNIMSRREFLALFAGAVGIAVAEQSKLASLIKAALSRPDAPPEEPRNDIAKFIVDEIWEKHFQAREDVFPLQTWRVMKSNIYELAKLYYDTNHHHGETLDNYFVRFMDEFIEAAETAGLDPVLAVISFQVSGENNGEDKYRDDIKAGQLQLAAGWLGRTTGHQTEVDSLFTDQPDDKALSRPQQLIRDMAEGANVKTLSFPIKILDAPRISGPLTTGIHDIESVCLARSIIGTSDPRLQTIKAQLEQDHPGVVKVTKEIFNAYIVLDMEREAFGHQLETLEAALFPLLEDFFDYEKREEAFTRIGVSKDFIDDWHRSNFSIPWAFLVTASDETAFSQVLEYYDPSSEATNGIREDNRLHRLQRRLLFDEIRNPLFLEYLKEKAATQGQQDALATVEERLEWFNRVTTKALEADMKFVAAVGPHELDSRFQLTWGMAYMKSLQNLVEQNGGAPLDSYSKNSLAWMAFQMLSLREFTPIFYTTPHGRDAHPPIRSKADPSAQDLFTLQELLEAVDYAEKEGVLPARPEDNIYPFIWFLRTFDHYNSQVDYLWHDIGRKRFNYINHYMSTGIMNGPYSSVDRALKSVSDYLSGFEGDIYTPMSLSEAREMQERQIIRVNTPDEIYAELERLRREGSTKFCEFILAPGEYEFMAPMVLPPNVNFIFNGSADTKLHFPIGVKSGFMFTEEHTSDFSFYIANMDISSNDNFTLVNARKIGEQSKPNFVVQKVNFHGLKNKESTVVAARNGHFVRIMLSDLHADRILEVAGTLKKTFTFLSDFTCTRSGVLPSESHAFVVNPHKLNILKDEPNLISIHTSYNEYVAPFNIHSGFVSLNSDKMRKIGRLGSAPRVHINGGDYNGFPDFDPQSVQRIDISWLNLHLTDTDSMYTFIHRFDAYPTDKGSVNKRGIIYLPKQVFDTLSKEQLDLPQFYGFEVRAEEQKK